VLVHVNGLFITSKSRYYHAKIEKCMRNKYKEIKVNAKKVVDNVGITFDIIVLGQESITMGNFERSILSDCDVWSIRATTTTSTLFDEQHVPKATYKEVEFFRTFVAKLLYRVERMRRLEYLVAVAFLTTRVHGVVADDMDKLKRVLGYLRPT
jgi:hypothetical protein